MTEPAEPILAIKATSQLTMSSLTEAVNKAKAELGTGNHGRVRLTGIRDNGQVGAKVELTFTRETAHGEVSGGVFGEWTAKGDRRAGGVVQWEW